MSFNFDHYTNLIHGVLGPLIPEGVPVALFDFPNHSNVGDSAIWLGEIQYLQVVLGVKIITVDDLALLKRPLPKLPVSAIILLHGGGNFGDLYPRHQALRERVIKHYQYHRIIQLPQSIHFQDQTQKILCQQVLNGHGDFHLLVRDHDSLAQAEQLHDGFNYLCPDMALCLGSLPRNVPVTQAIIGLLRTDKEKVIDENVTEQAMDNFLSVDWIGEPYSQVKRFTGYVDRLHAKYPNGLNLLSYLKRPLYHRLAKERLTRGCKLLSSGKVIITDRLHAHILCCLLGIPHVVLDNSYRKIGNFRDVWETGGDMCLSASSLDIALVKAEELLNRLVSEGN